MSSRYICDLSALTSSSTPFAVAATFFLCAQFLLIITLGRDRKRNTQVDSKRGAKLLRGLRGLLGAQIAKEGLCRCYCVGRLRERDFPRIPSIYIGNFGRKLLSLGQ